MDQLQSISVDNLNTRVLCEPRGFMRIINFFMAILAFSTTCAMTGVVKYKNACGEALEYSISYPFKLEEQIQVPLNLSVCPYREMLQHGVLDVNGSAEFYVFVGVMAFLYCLASLVFYVVAHETYEKIGSPVPDADFVVTCIFVFLWFIASCVWAAGVSDAKSQANPDSYLAGCAKCSVQQRMNFVELNISLVFGFLNVGLWGYNVWLTLKETRYWQQREQAKTGGGLPPAAAPGGGPVSSAGPVDAQWQPPAPGGQY